MALSVGSRPPGVTWHPALWSPDFPPPDRSPTATVRPTHAGRVSSNSKVPATTRAPINAFTPEMFEGFARLRTVTQGLGHGVECIGAQPGQRRGDLGGGAHGQVRHEGCEQALRLGGLVGGRAAGD